MILELDLTRIRRWVDARNFDLPERAQGLIRDELDVTDRIVTILECRPDFGADWTRFPVARLRYTKTRGEWSLYWRDRNLKFTGTTSCLQLLTSRISPPRSSEIRPLGLRYGGARWGVEG